MFRWGGGGAGVALWARARDPAPDTPHSTRAAIAAAGRARDNAAVLFMMAAYSHTPDRRGPVAQRGCFSRRASRVRARSASAGASWSWGWPQRFQIVYVRSLIASS